MNIKALLEFYLCKYTSSSASILPRQFLVQVSLNTNIYCIDKLDKISDLKVFLNACANHWKCCGGPHVARGQLTAHPCPMWCSDILCSHWPVLLPLFFNYTDFYWRLVLFAQCFFGLFLLISSVIWNNQSSTHFLLLFYCRKALSYLARR